ncbi:MAG: hypothetical protein IKC04_04100, partial [Oscillospiraceae bacterium]|nr:hypothetical protein [Oscillospiraceae bacterium]
FCFTVCWIVTEYGAEQKGQLTEETPAAFGTSTEYRRRQDGHIIFTLTNIPPQSQKTKYRRS